MARTNTTTRRASAQDVARETLRRLLTRKSLTHDDGVRGTHAGLYLCAIALEELAAQGVDADRDELTSKPVTHSMWACTACGFAVALDAHAVERIGGENDPPNVACCPLCTTVTLHPLPPRFRGPS